MADPLSRLDVEVLKTCVECALNDHVIGLDSYRDLTAKLEQVNEVDRLRALLREACQYINDICLDLEQTPSAWADEMRIKAGLTEPTRSGGSTSDLRN